MSWYMSTLVELCVGTLYLRRIVYIVECGLFFKVKTLTSLWLWGYLCDNLQGDLDFVGI